MTVAKTETPDERPSSFDYESLIACGRGDLFGEGNAQLPLPPMLMFDRISEIAEAGVEVHSRYDDRSFDPSPQRVQERAQRSVVRTGARDDRDAPRSQRVISRQSWNASA